MYKIVEKTTSHLRVRYGNRKRHRTPLEKKHRLTRLLCIEEDRYQYLKQIVNSNKRIYRKTEKKLPERTIQRISNEYDNYDIRVIMSTWYHGKFSSIKTRNCTEEQLWGDLTQEQQMKLKEILAG